jgi:hypothetical protein
MIFGKDSTQMSTTRAVSAGCRYKAIRLAAGEERAPALAEGPDAFLRVFGSRQRSLGGSQAASGRSEAEL